MFFEEQNDFKRLGLFLTGSAAGHLLILIVVAQVTLSSTHRSFSPGVINVDLVSFSPLPSKGDRNGGGKVRQKAPKKRAALKPKPKAKAISAKKHKKKKPARIKPKRSLKKKSFQSYKVVEKSIEKIRKNVRDSEPPSLQQALSRIAGRVTKEEGRGRGAGGNDHGTGTSARAGGRITAGLMDIYRADILYQIQQNWSFSDELAGGRKDLEVKMGIKIMPNGEIRDIWFDKPSGNSYLDESARKAVLKSNPLPPLPRGFSEPFLNQGLRFTVAGVN